MLFCLSIYFRKKLICEIVIVFWFVFPDSADFQKTVSLLCQKLTARDSSILSVKLVHIFFLSFGVVGLLVFQNRIHDDAKDHRNCGRGDLDELWILSGSKT